MIKETLEKLLLKEFLVQYNPYELNNSKNRLNILKGMLDKRKIKYSVETQVDYLGDTFSNVVVKLGKAKKENIVLTAHYDIVKGSNGINDNWLSVVMLIAYIMEVKRLKAKPNIVVLFTDREESGMFGSSMYASKYKDNIKHVLVFDIIGYGDLLIQGNREINYFRHLDQKLDLITTSTVLPGDNLSFINKDIRATLITAIHYSDLIYEKEIEYCIARPYENSIGTLPEAVEPISELLPRVKTNAQFYESFHNREHDNKMEIINFEIVERLRERLILLYGKS